MKPRPQLIEILLRFLRLGVVGFGGPPAHLALFRREFVAQESWLTEKDFLGLIGLANLVPGPTSTEVAMLIGHKRAGLPGLLMAGIGFILPAVILTFALAVSYGSWGNQLLLADALHGVRPAVIGVTAAVAVTLAQSSVKTRPLGAVLVGALVLSQLKVPDLLCLLVPAVLYAGFRPKSMGVVWWPLVSVGLQFLSIGITVFGGGYVLASFIQSTFANRLPAGSLLDAIAIGQVTPGPVFSMATFVGYLLNGPYGAAMATIGIFVPAFLLAAVVVRLGSMVQDSPAFRRFLDAVTVGSIALIVSVAIRLSPTVEWSPGSVVICSGSGVAILRKVSPVGTFLLAALAGIILRIY